MIPNCVPGVVQIDLYSLATGPSHYEMAINDGPVTRGTLTFDLEMSQVSFLTIAQASVEVALDSPFDGQYPMASLQLKLSYQDDPKLPRKTKAMTVGVLSFRELDRVRFVRGAPLLLAIVSDARCSWRNRAGVRYSDVLLVADVSRYSSKRRFLSFMRPAFRTRWSRQARF